MENVFIIQNKINKKIVMATGNEKLAQQNCQELNKRLNVELYIYEKHKFIYGK